MLNSRTHELFTVNCNFLLTVNHANHYVIKKCGMLFLKFKYCYHFLGPRMVFYGDDPNFCENRKSKQNSRRHHNFYFSFPRFRV